MLKPYPPANKVTPYKEGMTPEECGKWTDQGRRLIYHWVATIEDSKDTVVVSRCWLYHKQTWHYECQPLWLWEWTQQAVVKRQEREG